MKINIIIQWTFFFFFLITFLIILADKPVCKFNKHIIQSHFIFCCNVHIQFHYMSYRCSCILCTYRSPENISIMKLYIIIRIIIYSNTADLIYYNYQVMDSWIVVYCNRSVDWCVCSTADKINLDECIYNILCIPILAACITQLHPG
jgi:hypothetical protein